MMERFCTLTARQQAIGPRGASFLIDMYRCYHCGSRILDGSFRVEFIATYTTSSPFYDYDNEIELAQESEPDRLRVLRV